MLFIKKKDCSTCMYINYKLFNKVMAKNLYPMPHINFFLTNLKGHQCSLRLN